MKLVINNDLKLTEIRADDKASLLKYLNDESIFRNTMSIPSPYQESDADTWIALNQKIFKDHGNHFNLAIRKDEELVGVIGLLDVGPPHPHRSEVGYWLAKPFRNQGMMSKVLQRFIGYAFEQFDLTKLTALVFAGNEASEKVLIRCGFQLEGQFRAHFMKNGHLIDAVGFGLLRDAYESRQS